MDHTIPVAGSSPFELTVMAPPGMTTTSLPVENGVVSNRPPINREAANYVVLSPDVKNGGRRTRPERFLVVAIVGAAIRGGQEALHRRARAVFQMAQRILIRDVDHAGLPADYHQIGSRYQDGAIESDIQVGSRGRGVIRRSEPVRQCQTACRELQNRLRKIGDAIVIAVGGYGVNVAGQVGGSASTLVPDLRRWLRSG